MTSMPFSIISITVLNQETPTGAVRLASVDIALGPVRLSRCSLLRLREDKYTIAGPQIEVSKKVRVPVVTFSDAELRAEIADAALDAYEALTGASDHD